MPRCSLLALLFLMAATPARADEGPPPARPAPAAIDQAIEKGVDWILGKQKPRGDFGDVGKTALAAFALHHAGLHETQATRQGKRLAKALRWLDRFGPAQGTRAEPKAKTYDLALMLMLLRVRGRPEDRDRMQRLATMLWKRQAANGQWWYDGKGAPNIDVGDNSNTQFAVLALGHAQAVGLKVPAATWRRVRAWWTGAAGSDGGFGYASGGSSKSASTASMTAAGIACLALVDAALPAPSQPNPEVTLAEARSGLVQAHALAFLAKHFSVSRNHGPTPSRKKQRQRNAGRGWLHYYLWSVERAMVLAGKKTLGERDWYDAGARRLLDTQHKDGSWRQEAPLYSTSFALLFLTRAADPPRVFTPQTPGVAKPTKPKPPVTGEGPKEPEAAPDTEPASPAEAALPPGTVTDWLQAALPVGALARRCRRLGVPSLGPLIKALDAPDRRVRQRAWEALTALLQEARVRGADRHPLARGRLSLWLRLRARDLELRDGRFVDP